MWFQRTAKRIRNVLIWKKMVIFWFCFFIKDLTELFYAVSKNVKSHPTAPSDIETSKSSYARCRYPKRVWIDNLNISGLNLEEVCIKDSVTKTGSGNYSFYITRNNTTNFDQTHKDWLPEITVKRPQNQIMKKLNRKPNNCPDSLRRLEEAKNLNPTRSQRTQL